MSFTSIEFALFLLVGLVLYGLVPKEWRWGVLLAASYTFYGLWNWQFIWVLALITIGTFWTARRMAGAAEDRQKRRWFYLGLAIVLGFLGGFKYYDALLQIFQYFAHSDQQLTFLNGVAPLGIAFFSLQVIAYLADVYRGQLEPSDHLGHYALFVSFFPQLVAGPITRAQKLLPQIKYLLPVLPEELRAGFHRLLLGSFQKFVIADRLANFTIPVFEDHASYSSLVLLANLYIYAFQIYTDFAGYSNIAIGIAKLFGVNLAENFRQPYLALDIADFWNRWHISLSNWLRDYIFYPTMRFLRQRTNTGRLWWLLWVSPLVTMLVSGIWHGTGLNFILWGLMHGIMLALAASTSRWRKKVKAQMGKAGWIFNLSQWLITFNFLVFSWAFFRLPGLGTSIAYLRDIAVWNNAGNALEMQLIVITVLISGMFLLSEILTFFGFTFQRLEKSPVIVRWALYYAVIFMIIFMGNFEGSQQFIYEQF